jgi:hypothetical protein
LRQVSHCDVSKHPAGIPICNSKGNVFATAVVEIKNTGKIMIKDISVNAVECECLISNN